ncbi:hypothetical protein N864_06385 [Intrasporangium chromatireducens Q5-1]|uniref:Uncharacterized protein n=1 Tax=Intrasporangium chromatireducens Q5-1 TaxID=584657 RepID=W9GMU6_9MICO|nr:hypothetical protein N864_06385 [Intrasporangium chromatireducens Q5-1]
MADAAVTIAIWGSCVTRDIFEEVPSPEIRLRYHARSSWVSQASPSGDEPVAVPTGTGFAERTVREDLTKAIVPQLVGQPPETVIFDLIDERFDLAMIRQRAYSLNDYYGRLGLEQAMRDRAGAVSEFRDDAREDLFAGAVATLAPTLLTVLPRTKFVLHVAWYTARSADASYRFYSSAPNHVAWCNERLAHHYAVLIDHFGDRLHLLEPDRATCLVSDPGHRWGLAHFHYVPEYYRQAAAQLSMIRSGPLQAGRPRYPLAPTRSESGAVAASLPPVPGPPMGAGPGGSAQLAPTSSQLAPAAPESLSTSGSEGTVNSVAKPSSSAERRRLAPAVWKRVSRSFAKWLGRSGTRW